MFDYRTQSNNNRSIGFLFDFVRLDIPGLLRPPLRRLVSKRSRNRDTEINNSFMLVAILAIT